MKDFFDVFLVEKYYHDKYMDFSHLKLDFQSKKLDFYIFCLNLCFLLDLMIYLLIEIKI